jgi:hypothetical protein
MPYKNKEDQKAWAKRYREKNKEKLKEYKAKYFKENREREMGKSKEWRKNNLEKDREHRRKYAKKHKEKIKRYGRKWSIKKTYNLSYEDWLKIWESQNGKCAICGELFVKPSDAHTDHNHKIYKIRGLLCRNCNIAIGLFKDNPELTIKATEYLLRNHKKS